MPEQNDSGNKPISSGLQPGPGEHLADASPLTQTQSSASGTTEPPGQPVSGRTEKIGGTGTTTSPGITGAGMTSGTGSGGTSMGGASTGGTTSGTGMGGTSTSGTTSGTGMGGTSMGGTGMGGATSGTGMGDGSTGMSASSLAAKAKDTVREGSARLTGEAKQYASNLANMAKEKSRTVFEEQRDTAAGQMDSLTHALRTAADQLQSEGQPAGQYISMAVDRIESIGQRLRQKDLDTLLDDAQNLARRSPAVFFAGTVIAGFLLARFMKASSERRYESADMMQDDWRTRSDAMSQSRSYPAPSGAAADVYSGAGMPASGMSGASGSATSRDSDMTGSGTPGALGADGTPSAARGTTSAGIPPSGLNGNGTGGNTYGNR